MAGERAFAIRGHKTVPIKQPLSGYIVGRRTEVTYRVRIQIGRNFFDSVKEYGSHEAATAAARRLGFTHD